MGSSFTFFHRRNGDKFRATWEDVIKHKVSVVQIATWNDLNEGGTVEPVKPGVLHPEYGIAGYGYRELETVAQYASRLKPRTFDKESLRIPCLIYQLRKMLRVMIELNLCSPGQADEITSQIDNARDFLLAGRIKASRELIEDILKCFPDDMRIDPDWLADKQTASEKRP